MSPSIKLISGLSLLFCGAASACHERKQEAPSEPVATAQPVAPAPPDPAAAARQLFRVKCSVCHGQGGAGDGPGGAALNPKPRVFTDAAWQASATDAQIREIIVKGGAGVGKSVGMPSNPDLEQKPEVVGELLKIVRGFKG